MPAQDPTGVRRGEDTGQTAMTGDEDTSNVPLAHLFEHAIKRLARVNGIGVRHEDVPHKELVFGSQSEVGVEHALEVSIGQHAHELVSLLDREMSDFVANHERSCDEQTVSGLHEVRKRRHHGTDRGNVVHVLSYAELPRVPCEHSPQTISKDHHWLGEVITKHYHGDNSDVK